MKYSQTITPKTITLLSATFTLSAPFLEYLETLDLSGPEGKWAETNIGEGHFRVYGPDSFAAGETVLGRLSIHTSQQGREYKRVVLSLRIEYEQAIEMSEYDFAFQAARHLGIGSCATALETLNERCCKCSHQPTDTPGLKQFVRDENCPVHKVED